MGMNQRQAAILVVVSIAASSAGVTVHRSFRGGYPSAVSEARQNAAESGASLGGTRVSRRTRVDAYKRLAGRVTKVDEGDVIWVTNASGRHQVRLERIDAPEIDQPFGQEATQFLSDLVLEKEVEVRWTGKDQRKRLLGIVFLKHDKGMVNVNLTMVKNGCAWCSSGFRNTVVCSSFDGTLVYQEAEKDARKNHRGLWKSEETPVRPDKWGKAKGKSKAR